MAGEIRYNNSLFSPSGRLNRLFYILHNGFWNIMGFRFIYYPVIIEGLHSSPSLPILLNALNSNPQTKAIVPYLSATPKEIFLFVVLKYVFMLILRLVDIKRLRDICNRELSAFEQVSVAILFSVPYVDFLSTFFLSLVAPNKFAKSKIMKDIQKTNLQSAQIEKFLEMNKKMFETGKISRAEFEKVREKYKAQ